MKYLVSCSFGKDSVATALLALEKGEPIDGLIYCEVMYDHSRNISGEIPEHIAWIRGTAIPRLDEMGLKTIIVKGERDYVSYFQRTLKRGKYVGKIYGFPLGGKCTVNRDCKVLPIQKYLRTLGEDVTSYVGIAIDEPVRLARLKPGCISLLAKYNYTEEMAKELCEKYGLLSPIYTTGTRGGCWFCPNAKIASYCRFRRNNPELWREFEALAKTPNLVSYGFKYGKTLPEIVAKMDWHDLQEQNTLFPELYER